MTTPTPVPASLGRAARAPRLSPAARLAGSSRGARVAGIALALALLAAVFAAYLDPQLVFALANRAWACL